MKATVTSMTGFEDAFVSMFISKRNWTPELDEAIRRICRIVLDKDGALSASVARERENDKKPSFATKETILSSADRELLVSYNQKFQEWLGQLLKMGRKHITVLRYIDIAIMTEGIHRAGQDDIDSHAKRFDNRIIRSSTRLATFDQDEMSDYYKDKVMTTDAALKTLGIKIPEEFDIGGDTYIKSPNGYIKKKYQGNKDVMRGLYMQSIPSNFISKINLCEWAHVYKQRNSQGTANPEVKQWAEQVMEQITRFHEQITREAILSIDN